MKIQTVFLALILPVLSAGMVQAHHVNEKTPSAIAVTEYRIKLDIDPEDVKAHYNLALAYSMQDPPLRELARWHYQKALEEGHPRSAELEQMLEQRSAP